MRASSIILGMSSVAAASPIASRMAAFPPLSKSHGFKLVVNITDLSMDFTPSIQNYKLTAIHTGAARNRAVLRDSTGLVFYQNGTDEDNKYWHSDIIADAGQPPYPLGIQIFWAEGETTKHDVTMDIGAGSMSVMLSSDENPLSFINPLEKSGALGTFIACNETIPYYPGQFFFTLDWLVGGLDAHNKYVLEVPDHCAPIHLVPQCAPLPDLPEGAYSSHEFAQEVRCYEDVAAIGWS
jgi:hypothetical protein